MSEENTLPIGDVKGILDKAPSDIVEEVLPIPEWGCSVKVRSLTARQAAEVKQVGLELGGKAPQLIFVEMEKKQFLHGVTEPKFRAEDVNVLFEKGGGAGWSRVINWIDEHSGTSQEEREKAARNFPESPGE